MPDRWLGPGLGLAPAMLSGTPESALARSDTITRLDEDAGRGQVSQCT